LTIDNGQHVFLRCCDAYRDLLVRLNAQDEVTLQKRLDIPVLHPDGRQARLGRVTGVPAPAHLGAALATYSLLAPADRLRVIRAALALRRLNPADRSLDAETLGSFLRRHGQNDATMEAMWGIFAVATLNLPPDEASLALAAKVFRTGLLDHAPAADVGYAAVPLGRLHSTRALEALTAAGVDVRLNHGAEHVDPDGTVLVNGAGGSETIEADAIVLALPHREAFGATPALRTSPAAPAAQLGASPILNVHVVYDRKVTDLAFAAAVDSPVQWFFDRTDTSGLRDSAPHGQYLAVTVSSADELIERPSREIQQTFVSELGRLLPTARSAEVRDVFVTREKRATFRQAPGSWAKRPSASAGPGRIWLAGAWTDTGWPDTMEGAVRSGITAAESALRVPATGIRATHTDNDTGRGAAWAT
jgi:squalene-associated FAD-dependent desaturase